jgi:uncharacterized membrane protein YcaP (DUF421 family)
MDMVLRGASIYCVVWLCFRLSGRRTMAQMTTFDFVLLLICGEATQQALLGNDFSITNAAIVVLTLIGLDLVLTSLRARLPALERVMEGRPLVIMSRGRPLKDRMARERIDVEDILHVARHTHGISRLDEIEHAVLETSGGISIIPARRPDPGA